MKKNNLKKHVNRFVIIVYSSIFLTIVSLIDMYVFDFLGTFDNIIYLVTKILVIFVISVYTSLFLLVIFFGGYFEIKRFFNKVTLSGKSLIYGKKIIDLELIHSIWIFDNAYWLCTTSEETTRMERAVKMESDNPPVVIHFSTNKVDLSELLEDRKENKWKDVVWYVK